VNCQLRGGFTKWYCDDLRFSIRLADMAAYIDRFCPPNTDAWDFAGSIHVEMPQASAKWIDLRPLLDLFARVPNVTLHLWSPWRVLLGNGAAAMSAMLRHFAPRMTSPAASCYLQHLSTIHVRLEARNPKGEWDSCLPYFRFVFKNEAYCDKDVRENMGAHDAYSWQSTHRRSLMNAMIGELNREMPEIGVERLGWHFHTAHVDIEGKFVGFEQYIGARIY
jgi:hypothetical protein